MCMGKAGGGGGEYKRYVWIQVCLLFEGGGGLNLEFHFLSHLGHIVAYL